MTMTRISLICAAAGLLCATSAHAQTCVKVEVQGVVPDQGMVMVAAYDNAADFSSRKAATALQLRPTAATLSFSMCGVSGSTVALTLYQDLNGNGKLDTNLLGIPSEPWGASGKPSNFSAPTWDTSQVPINDSPIVIKI
jgi:uncharacterized protein (DUF2141 family)